MKEVIVKVRDITKIRKFENETVIYTKGTCWVCIKEQVLPTADDVFITLILANKGKCDKYAK